MNDGNFSKSLFENFRLESRPAAGGTEARANRLQAELRTHFDPPPVTFQTDFKDFYEETTWAFDLGKGSIGEAVRRAVRAPALNLLARKVIV